MKKTIVIGLAALITGGVARAEDLTISTDVTFASDYVFRGLKLADNSLQPSIEVGLESFYAGIWVNQPLENRSSNSLEDEIDFYLGITPQLSDLVSLDIGATHYYYTGATGRPATDASTEFFVGANFDFDQLTPGIYAYYDFDLEVFTIQGNLGFSIPLDQIGSSLDLGIALGRVEPSGDGDYTYYSVGASVPYKINEHATLKVGVNWASHTLDGMPDDHLWFTAGITVGF